MLEIKFQSQSDPQHVYMLWEKCIPSEFYRFVCQNNNFIGLNKLYVMHGEPDDIVCKFFADSGCSMLVKYFEEYNFGYQYVCCFKKSSCLIKSTASRLDKKL